MAAWKLPFLVLAIAAPTALAFFLGGPGVGIAVGALAAVAIVVVAARARPRTPIGSAPTPGSRRRLLLVVSRPVEGAEAIAAIAQRVRGEEGDSEVLVLSPARIGFLDRWASDVEGARHEAQQNLVITIAALAKAGIAAEARVGDEDLVQAVEDTVGSYAATEVLLITGGEGEDPGAERAAAELKARLRAPFAHLALSDSATR